MKENLQDFEWVCNECDSHEYTSSVNEADLIKYLSCGNCGSNEFHKEYLTVRTHNIEYLEADHE